MSKTSSIRIATRNSPLALWQANFIKQKIEAAHAGIKVEIIGMTTLGDQLLDRSLAAVGGKGLFLKELEVSLLNNETDIAVHSMKDVPADLPRGLEIAVVCEREDARDAFVSNNFQNLYALPKGARVGTSSLRRTSQLKSAFPAFEFVELRGNVNTRLAKLDKGEYDAIILAAAGLIRLGFVDRVKQYITPELCLPAVGQGIVGIECRSNDEVTKALLKPLHNNASELYVAAERTMNAALGGGCQVPVAGFAEVIKGKIRMRGMVGEVDGSNILTCNVTSSDITISSAKKLGREVAMDLILQGAEEILNNIVRPASDPTEPTANDKSLPTMVSDSGAPAAKRVVVLTREEKFLGNMPRALVKLGFQVELVETLRSTPLSNKNITKVFENIDGYTDIVFVSRNAVEFGMSIVEQSGQAIAQATQVIAMGAESAKQLMKHNIIALYPDNGTGAEALLSVKQLADLSQRRVLIVRGTQGLDWPADEMRNRGAQVDQVNVYDQSLPLNASQKMQKLLGQEQQSPQTIFLHSGHSARNFIDLVSADRERFSKTKLVVGSRRIAEMANELNWNGGITIAESPSNKHMMLAFTAS
ncbi:MAG: hydroxymethylbilane synthase [Arenicella sp.]